MNRKDFMIEKEASIITADATLEEWLNMQWPLDHLKILLTGTKEDAQKVLVNLRRHYAELVTDIAEAAWEQQ